MLEKFRTNVLKHVPGTSIHFTRTLRSILYPCVPRACGGNKITTNTDDKANFHTYEWKFSGHFYTKLAAGAKRLYAPVCDKCRLQTCRLALGLAKLEPLLAKLALRLAKLALLLAKIALRLDCLG